jgi:hypothetical protein
MQADSDIHVKQKKKKKKQGQKIKNKIVVTVKSLLTLGTTKNSQIQKS